MAGTAASDPHSAFFRSRVGPAGSAIYVSLSKYLPATQTMQCCARQASVWSTSCVTYEPCSVMPLLSCLLALSSSSYSLHVAQGTAVINPSTWGSL